MSRKHLVESTRTVRNVNAGSLCRQRHTLLTELLEWTLYGSLMGVFGPALSGIQLSRQMLQIVELVDSLGV